MADAQITVLGSEGATYVSARPSGMLIGRMDCCDIVLDDAQVSRRHARLHQDPFGRWVIEDLDSRHGVWIGGQQVRQSPVGPGQRIRIGPFAILVPGVAGQIQRRADADATCVAGASVLSSSTAERLSEASPGSVEMLSSEWLRELSEIGDQLSKLNNAAELYAETCRSVAVWPGVKATVIRLFRDKESSLPQVLGCSGDGALSASERVDSDRVRFSRSVLARVRSSGAAVLASNVHLCDSQIDLTVAVDGLTRTVCCAPIDVDEDSVDALYLDFPSGQVKSGVLDFARALARQVCFARKAILTGEEAAHRRVLDHEIEKAREMVKPLSPRASELPAVVDLAFHYKPALWVGGDYCDFWLTPDGRLAFAVGDVAGKGLSAAIAMANLHAALRTSLTFVADLSEAFGCLNLYLSEHLPDGIFVTLLAGIFNPGAGQLNYVNAGHLLPLIIRHGDVRELGMPMNLPLGVGDTLFRQESVTVEDGCGLVVFTDGITEATSAEGGMLGAHGVIAAVRGVASDSSQAIASAIASAADRFRDPLPQQDDATILVIRNARMA